MSQSAAFVRLFAGFLLCAAGVHASCPIKVNPPSVVVKYGDPVSINCTALDAELEGMGWEASENGISLTKTQHLTWSVDQLTDWEISPMCFFNPSPSSSAEQCSETANVVVYTFPENISISSSNDRGATENEKYSLTCEILNVAPVENLTVRWYRGDAIVHNDTFKDSRKMAVNQPSVFNFTPTRQDDNVTFRCEAHLDLRPEGPYFNVSSPEIKVEVFFGPEVSCDGTVELQEGTTLDQQCPVTGNPAPFVEWLKNEELMNSNVPLSRNDGGMYILKARGHSIFDKALEVFVNYGPNLTCPSFYTAKEYTLNQLNCTVDGFPTPEITWYKDDEKVDRPENLTKSDKGQYVITASNIVSNVSQTVEITVTYPPSKIFELEDSEVDVGSTIGLKCSSVSYPRPKYSWDYYRTANVKEENEDGVSRLVIHNATAYNIGSYTCHAQNDEGNISKTVRLTVKGAKPVCPIEISPESLVVAYGEKGQKVTCKPNSTDSRNDIKIQWEDMGTKLDSRTWSADNIDWYSSPVCKAEFVGREECNKSLNLAYYLQPDNVSIHTVSEKVLENSTIQLQCDINNVAPAKNLVVWWNTSGSPTKGTFQVTTCLVAGDTDCEDISKSRSPVNVSSTFNITVTREDNGTEFSCWAQLDFGSQGKQLLNTTSSPLNIIVHYKPSINVTKLPKKIPLISGYSEDLSCEADGNPPPTIEWSYSPDLTPQMSAEGKLIVLKEGLYNCTATNSAGSVSHVVQVILKEDYLPLIAGFVAVVVVAISIIFVFIYSIYYKNTKMRRYSLKNPKLSTHNGNVAHNGWDLQFPMTKLC